jgi:hypothetical protein
VCCCCCCLLSAPAPRTPAAGNGAKTLLCSLLACRYAAAVSGFVAVAAPGLCLKRRTKRTKTDNFHCQYEKNP